MLSLGIGYPFSLVLIVNLERPLLADLKHSTERRPRNIRVSVSVIDKVSVTFRAFSPCDDCFFFRIHNAYYIPIYAVVNRVTKILYSEKSSTNHS